jgi:hypothetical protein
MTCGTSTVRALTDLKKVAALLSYPRQTKATLHDIKDKMCIYSP